MKSQDKQFAAATIQAIGRCATNITEVTDTCLNGLVCLLSNRDGKLNVLFVFWVADGMKPFLNENHTEQITLKSIWESTFIRIQLTWLDKNSDSGTASCLKHFKDSYSHWILIFSFVSEINSLWPAITCLPVFSKNAVIISVLLWLS